MPASKLVRFICVVCGEELEALCDARRGEKMIKCPGCGGTVRRSEIYVPVPGFKTAKRKTGAKGQG
ncbi:MAG: hypothetical protein C4589_07660 [Peptococcaceae bacterium]|nr:MAG: hypothetical protein C4589_07660 [Peptococcaceae bacterium]